MLASKLLFVLSLYLLYKFTAYFYSFIKNGFPGWNEDLIIGNATFSLFFAPYGALVAITLVCVLLYVSGKDLYVYYLSNKEALAKITRFESSTDDTSDNAPINIIIDLNGKEITLDFVNADLKNQFSVGDLIPVKYFDKKPNNAILDYKKINELTKNP